MRYKNHDLPVTPISPPEAKVQISEAEGIQTISNPVCPLPPSSSNGFLINDLVGAKRPLSNFNISNHIPSPRSQYLEIPIPRLRHR